MSSSDPPVAGDVSARRLRIAVLNRIFQATGGGAERYSIALVEQLAQRHEIHVFAQHIDHERDGVTSHKVCAPFERPRWVNQLWFALATWWLTRKGFDVVHSHENTWHGQVQTVHVLPVKHTLFHGFSGWRLVLRWVKVITSPRLLAYLGLERSRYDVGGGRAVVVTSESLKRVMAQVYPKTVSSLQVITPGVAAIHNATDAQSQRAARMNLGLPIAGRCVLFVGNDYGKKGLSSLIHAMRDLPTDVYLAVVGNAAQIPKYLSEARVCGQTDRIFFLGALKDVDSAYSAADCLAHPTQEDTFAMVVLEAMAYGLPVVVSSAKFCGISASLTHEGNALILEDPLDVGALSDAVKRVLSDPHLVQRLSVAARNFARSHLWPAIAQKQEAIYAAACDGQSHTIC
jgi:glycosyltransferase involved in cell wall biosynthesis